MNRQYAPPPSHAQVTGFVNPALIGLGAELRVGTTGELRHVLNNVVHANDPSQDPRFHNPYYGPTDMTGAALADIAEKYGGR